MVDKTTIQISKTTRDRLDSFKRHHRETYDEVIQKILTKDIKWHFWVNLGHDPHEPDLTDAYRDYLDTIEDLFELEYTNYGAVVYKTHDYYNAIEIAKKAYDIWKEKFSNLNNPEYGMISIETLPHCVICDREFSIGHKYCPYCGNTLERKPRQTITEIIENWQLFNMEEYEE